MSVIGWAVVITFGMLVALYLIGASNRTAGDRVPVPASPPANAMAYAPTQATWDLVGQQGDMHFVSIAEHDPSSTAAYHQAVTSLCAGRSHCFVHFWDAEHDAPRQLPMTEQQTQWEIAQYRMNLNTGLNRWAWRCERFDGTPAPGDCY